MNDFANNHSFTVNVYQTRCVRILVLLDHYHITFQNLLQN